LMKELRLVYTCTTISCWSLQRKVRHEEWFRGAPAWGKMKVPEKHLVLGPPGRAFSPNTASPVTSDDRQSWLVLLTLRVRGAQAGRQ
jgi:hypothetical protein